MMNVCKAILRQKLIRQKLLLQNGITYTANNSSVHLPIVGCLADNVSQSLLLRRQQERRRRNRKDHQHRFTVANFTTGSTFIHIPVYNSIGSGSQKWHLNFQSQHHQSSSYAARCFTSARSNNDDRKTKENIAQNSMTASEGDERERAESNEVYEHWIEQLKSPPNIITVSRIACTPVLSYLIVTDQHWSALIGCTVAALSDVADGYLAKNFNMSTVLGTYLDPIADKLMVNVLAVSLWHNAILPAPLVALWMARDVGIMAAGYRYVLQNEIVMDPHTTPVKISPTTISKMNTALQFTTIAVAIMHPIICIHGNQPIFLEQSFTALCWVTGGTTLVSGWGYIGYSGFTESGNPSRQSTSFSSTQKEKESSGGSSLNKSSSNK